jgi:hypothetical protein
VASVLLVCAGGAGDPFEVNTGFSAALVVPVMLMSVSLDSVPWIPGFSLSDNGALAEEAGVVAVAAGGVAAALLSSTTDGRAALSPTFPLTPLYSSSLLESQRC